MSINELHHKMEHVNFKDLQKMVKQGMVTGIDLNFDSKPDFCEACVKAKITCKPFPKQSEMKYTKYGDKVISNTWGPAPVESLGGKKYFQIYQDLLSHEECIYFNKNKSKGFDNYKKYKAWVKTQWNAAIKVFGGDRGGEFMSKAFNDHLEHAGTVWHLTVHDSPASNGSSKCANRTHVECA
jgi:GAG-pre-integrase domain